MFVVDRMLVPWPLILCLIALSSCYSNIDIRRIHSVNSSIEFIATFQIFTFSRKWQRVLVVTPPESHLQTTLGFSLLDVAHGFNCQVLAGKTFTEFSHEDSTSLRQ